MIDDRIAGIASGVPGLRGVLVVTMPDCLLYGSWLRPDMSFSAEEASGYFGDLIRANRQGLRAVGAWTSDIQVTIEGTSVLVVLREVDENYVVCAIFDREAPLGMVRLHLKIAIEQLREILPRVEAAQMSKGARILRFIERYAPDAHAVLHRVATRTRIPIERLRNPDGLSSEEVKSIEEAAKRILGIEEIHF
ncbi:MAG: hypothetical protein N2515_04745 [Deltaproteobacteria bacterium]|nr:hypothetical protein [Deltaproteobacteria bacterium]